jgi:hypothetical protein
MKRYEEVGPPGVIGSVDVGHVKWSNCPAGDFNWLKGKELYPSPVFECITHFDCRILRVFGPQFGSQNDERIVKLDTDVRSLSKGWFLDMEWQYYNKDETVKKATGVYLICNNGYISWPTTICLYMHLRTNNWFEDSFSTNLESVQKDV